MKLTGNALSMLLKRYRAVLGKCRTLNWLAGMVLAGGVVLGSVSGALAADYGPTQLNNSMTESVTVTGGTDSILPGTYTLGPAAGWAPEKDQNYAGIIITGTSPVIMNGVTITGSNFTTPFPGEITQTNHPNSWAVVLVNGEATLNITGNTQFTNNKVYCFGALTSTTTGNINISGSGNEFVNNISGGGGAALANFGSANMSLNSVLFKGNTVTGDEAAAGGGAVFMGSLSTNLINGATFTSNKVTSAQGAYGGAIASRTPTNKLDGTGSKINFIGTMTIANSTFDSNQANGTGGNGRGGAIYTAFKKAHDNTSSLSGAPTYVTEITGSALIYNSTFQNNQANLGGAIYNDGVESLNSGHANLTIADSTFTGNYATTDGGAIYNSAGATLTLLGTNTFENNTVAGDGPNDIYNEGGATLNIGNTTGADNATTTVNGGIVNMGVINVGKNATLQGQMTVSNLLAGSGASRADKVNIAAGGSLDMGTGTVILSTDQLSSIAGGTAGTIYLAAADPSGSPIAAKFYADDLTLNKGTTTPDFNSGILMVSNSFTTNASTAAQALKIKGGQLHLGHSETTTDGSHTITGFVATDTNGNMNISQGSWKLNTNSGINVAAKWLSIGGENRPASLDVTGGTFTSIAATAPSSGNPTAGTNVMGQGTLVINASQLLDGTALKNSSIGQIYVAEGGVLSIKYAGATPTEIALGDFKTLKGNVLPTGSSGMINLENAKITTTGNTYTDGGDTATAATDVNTSGAVLDATVKVAAGAGNTATVGGGYAAETLTITGVTAPNTTETVQIKGNVTLLGNSETTNLIDGGDNVTQTNVQIDAGQALNLGMASTSVSSNAGSITGDVKLNGDAAALNAATATYTIEGKVEGDGSNHGVVSSNAGANLIITGDSGKGIDGVNAVNTNNGIITVAGNISTQTITMNGGTILVAGLQSANSRLVAGDGLDGDLTDADGDITAADEVKALSGTNTISTTEGKIDLNAMTTVSAGASLTIDATGGDVVLAGTTLNPGGTLIITSTKPDESSDGGNVTSTADLQATSITAIGGNIAADDRGTNKDIAANIVSAADGTITAKTLTAGAAGVSADKINVTAQDLALGTGGLIMANGGTLKLTGGEPDATDPDAGAIGGPLTLTNVESDITGDLDVTGTATISGGEFNAQNGAVNFNNPTTIKGLTANFDEVGGTGAITVGSSDGSATGNLSANYLSNSGAMTVGGTSSAPAQVAIAYAGGTLPTGTPTTAGALQAGGITIKDNASVALGSNVLDDAAKANPAKGGLYVAKPIDLTNGGISVGSTADSVAVKTLNAGAGSTTVINAAALGTDGTTAAITGDAKVADGAKLMISGATVGQKIKLLTGAVSSATGATANDGWKDKNLLTDNLLITFDTPLGSTAAEAKLNSASNVMPKLDSSLVAAMNSVASQLAGVDSPDKGIQFLSRAISDKYLDAQANPDLAAKTIEGAARMVTIGAVPQMTRTANQAAAEAVTQRTSMAIPSSIQTQQATDKVALWIMPLYQSTNGARLDAGNMDADYHGGLGGIALGADYTFANAIRAGIAFNIGAGYATGGGDFADTTNNMNFWGLGAYAGWTGNNIGVSADVNFTSAYNKLTQDLPQSMGMRDLKADVRSYAFSTGLRGEYKLETSAVDITPHVGVRFMYLTTDDYKVKSEGTVLKGDGLHQNIWTFPIGVSFSKNIERSNGWHVKPMLDLAVVPAAGDIKAKENVRFSGTDYKAELETQVMDYITYQGVLGLEVGNQNLTFGLSGNTQFGEKTSGYGVLGSFRYEF